MSKKNNKLSKELIFVTVTCALIILGFNHFYLHNIKTSFWCFTFLWGFSTCMAYHDDKRVLNAPVVKFITIKFNSLPREVFMVSFTLSFLMLIYIFFIQSAKLLVISSVFLFPIIIFFTLFIIAPLFIAFDDSIKENRLHPTQKADKKNEKPNNKGLVGVIRWIYTSRSH